MTKLSDAELREPDVWIAIGYSKWDKLPANLRDEMRLFVKRDDWQKARYILRVPAYRFRAWEAAAYA